MRPCRVAIRSSGKTSWLSRSASSTAALASTASEASTSGQMHEDLMPFGHFFAHQGVGSLPLGADVTPGLDRDAPRRAMGENRDVEIAVNHEIERARDRSGGHRQLVG